jgi:hypothetical protein
MFAHIDANGDGEISQIEFIRALRNDSALAQRLSLPSRIRQEDGSRDLFALKYLACLFLARLSLSLPPSLYLSRSRSRSLSRARALTLSLSLFLSLAARSLARSHARARALSRLFLKL